MNPTSLRFCFALLAGFLFAYVQASTLKPPVLPLVVRNPYLSTWLRARDPPWARWPIFWNGGDMGMSLMAYVPDTKQVYPLFGRPQDSLPQTLIVTYPEYLGAQYDASTTNLTYRIPGPTAYDKPLELTISFLSPITPTSTLRQSIPASYITVTATGNSDVEIYMDLNGMWVTGNRGAQISWSMTRIAYDNTTSLQSWEIKKSEESLYTEFDEHGEWGKLIFTGPSDASFESGTSAILRQEFARNGTLNNQIDGNFRGVMDEEPVFAFSKTLKSGNTSDSGSNSVLFTIAHIQDPVLQFASARGLTNMRPLWKSWFLSEHALITFHYMDYPTASTLATRYSTQLAKDAYNTGAHDYMDIVALSARQVLGATTFSGTQDDPLIFLKEISSNGNTQTVDVIFPAFPFFMYTNPRWLAYLLEPLLEHQLSGQYPNKYSMHDLGTHFPNFTGHADGRDEYMPVEECGDMLIMGLALVNSLRHTSTAKSRSLWPMLNLNLAAQPSTDSDSSVFALSIGADAQDTRGTDASWSSGAQGEKVARAWLDKSYMIWKQWTEYLVEFSLMPSNQLCTDDFAGWLPLQTNLALKGIIGIRAMSELASVMGKDDEAKYYLNISTTYATKWATFGLTRDGSYAKLAYDWYGSWTTLYSLFPASMLCFETSDGSGSGSNSTSPLLPHGLFHNQSIHYANVLQQYGLPLDSRHLYTKSDWALEAAAVARPDVRAQIVRSVAKWLNETETDLPFTDLYETEGRGGFGAGNRFAARPVVGGHFAGLALGEACGGNGKAEGGMWDE